MTENKEIILLHGQGIYDVVGHVMLPEDGLLIRGERIDCIGFYDEIKKGNPEAETVDLRKCWLMPGLINTHVHLECDPNGSFQKIFDSDTPRIRFARAIVAANTLLRSGVTTVRDAGSDWGLLELLDGRIASIVQLPRLTLSGPPLTVTGGHLYFMDSEVNSAEEMVRSVRLHQKQGCGAIKIMITGGQMTSGSCAERTSFSTEQLRAAVEEAHRMGLPTLGHCLTVEGFVRSMESGIDSIEHCSCFIRNSKNGMLERAYEKDVMERYRGSCRFFSNTLASLWHCLDGYRSGRKPCTGKEKFLVEQEKKMLELFLRHCDLGLTPVLSTDAGVPQTWFDDTALELEIMVMFCGFTPAEAIDVATVNSAACLGKAGDIGRLEPGYYADIVALRSNPLDDISAWRDIERVYRGGENVLGPATRRKGDLSA